MGQRELDLNKRLQSNVCENDIYGFSLDYLESVRDIEQLILDNLHEIKALEEELFIVLNGLNIDPSRAGKAIRSLKKKEIDEASDDFKKKYFLWRRFASTLGQLINYRANQFIRQEAQNTELQGTVKLVDYLLSNFGESQCELDDAVSNNGVYHRKWAQRVAATFIYREANICAFNDMGKYLPANFCKKCGMIGYLELIELEVGLEPSTIAKKLGPDFIDKSWKHVC